MVVPNLEVNTQNWISVKELVGGSCCGEKGEDQMPIIVFGGTDAIYMMYVCGIYGYLWIFIDYPKTQQPMYDIQKNKRPTSNNFQAFLVRVDGRKSHSQQVDS